MQPGPYRATTCRERELTLDHIQYIFFWPRKGTEGLPGWVISLMPGPSPKQYEHIILSLIRSNKANMKGWLSRPNDIIVRPRCVRSTCKQSQVKAKSAVHKMHFLTGWKTYPEHRYNIIIQHTINYCLKNRRVGSTINNNVSNHTVVNIPITFTHNTWLRLVTIIQLNVIKTNY